MRLLRASIAAFICSASLALSAPISDAEDTSWVAVPGQLDFSIVRVSGAINGSFAGLGFGVYEIGDTSNTQELFGGLLAAGATASIADASLNSITSEVFGFYIENKTSSFGGPGLFYSDSALNPNGLDAMAATRQMDGSWNIEFEDAFLPLIPDGGDLLVNVAGAINPVPLPASLGFLALGLGGLVLLRRRSHA